MEDNLLDAHLLVATGGTWPPFEDVNEDKRPLTGAAFYPASITLLFIQDTRCMTTNNFSLAKHQQGHKEVTPNQIRLTHAAGPKFTSFRLLYALRDISDDVLTNIHDENVILTARCVRIGGPRSIENLVQTRPRIIVAILVTKQFWMKYVPVVASVMRIKGRKHTMISPARTR